MSRALIGAAIACLGGCLDWPDPEQDGIYSCTTSTDCLAGYTCVNGFCSTSAASGVSPNSLPATVTGINAVPSDSKVTLSWEAAAGAANYTVYRSEVSGSGFVALFANIVTTEATDETVVNFKTYYYTVSATNAAGEGPPSKEIQASPGPSPG